MVGTATYDFEGVAAIVTGSTKGIGRSVAAAFAEHDADVAVNARTESEVTQTAAELDELGEGTVVGIPGDMAEPDDVETLVAEAIEAFDQVDVLVNNAAVWPREGSLLSADLDEWDHTMAVNVRSQFYCATLVGRHMVEAGVDGRIVNVSSQTGDRRTGGRGLYGISNTAVNGLTWRLAHDFASEGIRVNAVSTDAVDTFQLRKEARAVADSEDTTVEAVLDDWGQQRPLGRLGRPDDVADGGLFLCSDRADYVVGDILRIGGGGNLQ